MVFKTLHDDMLQCWNNNSRKTPDYTLQYLNSANNVVCLVSPVMFNRVTKSALSDHV